MHVVIINGSPRNENHSNTDKIITAFCNGLSQKKVNFERFAISNKNTWDQIRDAYINNKEIIIALPLFVECVPGLLKEFLETLPVKDKDTRISFILQSGFAEGAQLRCGEEYLAMLTGYLGTSYGGTLVKGDNFGIRLVEGEKRDKQVKPYEAMGVVFAEENGFDNDRARKFTGFEMFPLPIRIMLGIIFKTGAKKMFENAATSWGCTVPLDIRPLDY